jgi:hypothetical protein
MQRLFRLEAAYPVMDAGVFRERRNEDGPGVVEKEQYGDFSIVEQVLGNNGVKMDFESNADLRYNHRRDGATDIYFVANPAGLALDATCTFRVSGKQPEIWDPITGTTRTMEDFTETDGRTSMHLRLDSHQSAFIVFSGAAKQLPSASRLIREFSVVRSIEGPWDVTFDPAWSGPGTVRFETLSDWSRHPVDSIRYFSGIARYRKTFDLPAEFTAKLKGKGNVHASLDLGTVHDMARVWLNGRELGVLWTAPWRVDAAGLLRAKGNALEIEVANRWRNRLVGDERFQADAEYGKDGNLLRWPEWLTGGVTRPSTGRTTFASWRHFTADTPLLPSGLLGPVQVMMQGN